MFLRGKIEWEFVRMVECEILIADWHLTLARHKESRRLAVRWRNKSNMIRGCVRTECAG